MADIYPIGPKFRLQAAQNGNILVMGNTSDEQPNGAVRVWFVPDNGCDAVFTVVGRVPRIQAADAALAPWIPVPYRRVTLSNVASDFAVVSDPVTGTSSILVPTVGGAVGLLVACTTGDCTIYTVQVEGASAP